MNGAASEADISRHLSFGVAAGVVLVVVIVTVLAIITDLSCYFVNRCGITMCICRSLGRSPGPISGSQSREKAMEEGERERLKGNADDDRDEEIAEQPTEKIKLEEVENDANDQVGEQAAEDSNPTKA